MNVVCHFEATQFFIILKQVIEEKNYLVVQYAVIKQLLFCKNRSETTMAIDVFETHLLERNWKKEVL